MTKHNTNTTIRTANPQVRYGFSEVRRRTRGFSFTEVMFAVIILGIGFIMIAAVFPVAIQQTKANSEESTAAAIAHGGVEVLKQLGVQPAATPTPNFPVTGNAVVAAAAGGSGANLAKAMKGNAIISTDPRYSWVALYRRGTSAISGAGEPYAQVYVLVVQNRSQSAFQSTVATQNVVPNSSGAPLGNATLTKIDSVTQGNTIDFSASPAEMRQCATDGAYVIVAATGRIFRLGGQVSADKWELQPGSDMTDNDADGAAGVFIVGKGLRNPEVIWNATANPHEGSAQDVSIYTTYISVTP